MGTVGLSFGSATSGAGFDVASTVNSILAISSGVETPWNAQLARLKAQDSALTSIGTDLATLASAVTSLTSFDGVLAAKQGSSSDTNVLSLTSASTAAIAGSHTVTVTSLASTSSEYTDSIANSSDLLSGSLTLQIGTAASTAEVPPSSAQTITIDSTNNTLSTLAAYINNGSYGVSASVVTDSSGSRLSLVSSTSGAAGQIQIGGTLQDATTSSTVGFTAGQNGADAILNVDGLTTTSASNTVTGAIPGVTFQLLSSPLNTPVQVQITNDNSAVETAVQSFVSAYNAVAGDIKVEEGKDASGNSEPLYGDPTIALIQSQLSAALSNGAGSGAIANIQQLGISANPDGTLTLDADTLGVTLNANFSSVVGFLQNTGSFGQSFTSTLNTLGSSSSTGAISLELAQNSTVENGLNTNLTNENLLLATERTNLTSELTIANEELQAIPQQLSEVNEIYSAVTGYNQNQNG